MKPTINEQIILTAALQTPHSEADLNSLKRAALSTKGKQKKLPSKTELLTAYHSLLKKKRIAPNRPLEKLLTRRAVRTLSGVTIVTSLVKPYPCPGQCVYCPLDERMPKSYLSEEPAAMRALMLKFDPYKQMARRLEALENNGHPTDKIEFIIKGGTWNSYPLAYQYWFVLESFRACNTRTLKHKNTRTLTEQSSLQELRKELKKQQRLNETARHRIIGLTLETRPDCITEKTIWQMREMGCTRIELGVQHTDDKILELTKRGHDSAETKRATELLKNFGFKTDFHLMPQLPGATPESDFEMLKEIFADPAYRPDMIKIYPCSVVKGSELYDWWKDGKYHAYPTDNLLRILKEFKATIVPRYCRISRLIRDIPGQYIEEGNKITNLRQVIQEKLRKEGRACQCLRCREIGHVANTIHDTHRAIQKLKPKLFIDEYEASGGTEYFLSFEDSKRRAVFAFCRLRICASSRGTKRRSDPLFKVLLTSGDCDVVETLRVSPPRNDAPPFPAYIRELHTYGQLVGIGKRQKEASQHTGLGKKLIQTAERIAAQHKIKKLAVISGVGVRDYYRHLGYRLNQTYLVKELSK